MTREAERSLKTMITVKEQDGADAIVLACTELEMIVDVDANVLPIYDCTRIHAEAAAEWILGEGVILDFSHTKTRRHEGAVLAATAARSAVRRASLRPYCEWKAASPQKPPSSCLCVFVRK